MLPLLFVVWAGFTGIETTQKGRLTVKSVDLLVGSDATRELRLEVQLSASDVTTGRVVCRVSTRFSGRLKSHPVRPVSFGVTMAGGKAVPRDYRLHARVASRPDGEVVENSIVVTMPDGIARCSSR